MGPSSIGSTMKSFWSRPEGKTGMIFLIALAVGAAFAWGMIVPYVVSMLADTVHMAILGVELAGILYLVFGKRPQLIYRLIMRKITGLIITIDPIGILKDNLLKARKRQDDLRGRVGDVSGSKQTLKDIMAKNKRTIENDLATAQEAQKRADSAIDPASKLRMQYEVKLRTNDIGRLRQSNENYDLIFQKISEVYDNLVKLSAGVDFYVADLEGTVREEEIKYKTINTAWSAFSTAMSIIRGSADEQDLYNQDLEFLADNASTKLGQIDEMMRLSQHFMDGVDLQNGAMDTKASKELEAYQQKLLTSGDQGAVSLLTGGSTLPMKEAVKVPAISDYDNFFKR